jgi:hypothetical protein
MQLPGILTAKPASSPLPAVPPLQDPVEMTERGRRARAAPGADREEVPDPAEVDAGGDPGYDRREAGEVDEEDVPDALRCGADWPGLVDEGGVGHGPAIPSFSQRPRATVIEFPVPEKE